MQAFLSLLFLTLLFPFEVNYFAYKINLYKGEILKFFIKETNSPPSWFLFAHEHSTVYF